MGNYKFRLSDMIPNAWFYKLKDMGNKQRTHSTNKKPISSSSSSSSKPKPKPQPPQQPHQFIQHRNSYYFNTTDPFRSSDKLYNSPVNPKVTDVHFPDPTRKSSSRKKSKRKPKPAAINLNLKPVQTCSVSSGCGCRATLDSVWAKTDSSPDSSDPPSPESNFHQSISPSFDVDDSHPSCWSTSSCSCRVSSSATDIIIDVDSTTTTTATTTTSNKSKFDGLDPISELELPPIVTKPEIFSAIKTREVEVAMETKKVGGLRRNPPKPEQKVNEKVKKKIISPRCSTVSPGVKIRANSPRIASKKIQAYSSRKTTMSTTSTRISLARRKRVAESFAIVKASIDPQKDFRESMVEMIVENNIRASKDLEELLACYLSLNSNEYHDLIVKVFEQIWFDLTDIPL